MCGGGGGELTPQFRVEGIEVGPLGRGSFLFAPLYLDETSLGLPKISARVSELNSRKQHSNKSDQLPVNLEKFWILPVFCISHCSS